jgi:catechol 2,3-dioxygenase-like lactoylglutathione lyase family enzyme
MATQQAGGTNVRYAGVALIVMALGLAAHAQDAPKPPAGVAYRPTLLVQIGVANLDRSIQFYRDMLGFRVTERRDDLQFAHLATNVPGLEIGLNEVEAPRGSGSVLLNISVEDANAARRALEAKGVVFRRPTIEIPGKVVLAEFADPDGNLLRFAGPPSKR